MSGLWAFSTYAGWPRASVLLSRAELSLLVEIRAAEPTMNASTHAASEKRNGRAQLKIDFRFSFISVSQFSFQPRPGPSAGCRFHPQGLNPETSPFVSTFSYAWKPGDPCLPFLTTLVYKGRVSQVTRILGSIAQGDLKTAEELLPEVYRELRHLAAARLSHEKPGQTLQATALVHEAWLRVAGKAQHPWHSRSEFFHAAAQAIRRILIENARRKQRRRALEGGDRVPLEDVQLASPLPDDDLLALDEGLRELARHHPPAAQLVELRFFAGLTQAEAAEEMRVSRSTADRLWLLARSWLYARIRLPRGGPAVTTNRH